MLGENSVFGNSLRTFMSHISHHAVIFTSIETCSCLFNVERQINDIHVHQVNAEFIQTF